MLKRILQMAALLLTSCVLCIAGDFVPMMYNTNTMQMSYGGGTNAPQTNLNFRTANIGNMTMTTNGIVVTNNFMREDLRFPSSAVKVGAVNPPDWDQMNGEIYGYKFSKTQEQDVNGAAQFPHTWDNGTIEPHLHLTTGTSTNGGTSVWQMVWWPATKYNAFPAAVFTNTVTNVWAKGTNWFHDWISFGSIPATTHGMTNVSAMLLWNIARKTGDAGDTGDDVVWFLEFDIHYNVKYVTGRN